MDTPGTIVSFGNRIAKIMLMLVPMILSTHLAMLDCSMSNIMTHPHTTWCHPNEHGFLSRSLITGSFEEHLVEPEKSACLQLLASHARIFLEKKILATIEH